MPDTAAQQLRRILRIIPEIADGQEHDLEEIAQRAGVSKNALLSDLRSIADRYTAPGGFVEGVQIFLGPDTVEVASDHFLRPMGLTVQELCALELGLAILQAERPPDETAAIERTRDRLRKVIANMPIDIDQNVMRHAEIAPTEGLPFLNDLRKALRDRRKARIQYRRSGSNEMSSRVVRLYAIVPASGMWYAVAWCELSEDLRVFRMDRVEQAEILADMYEIPSDFSLTETLQSGRGLKTEIPSTGMKVRYSSRIARWIAEREGVSPGEDGSVTLEHPLADADWGLRHVLQYGPDAEVIEPPTLRSEIVRRLETMRSR
ncbi:MAG TPA: WYL domain-containing protein [Gemmatimonadaceae bacterium]|nr:WYL domain-containing protein [Gemmatimonadaceae bacterium]